MSRILTQLTREDGLKIMEMGKKLHQESQFRDEPFDQEKVWNLFGSTISNPTRRFIAYDSEFRGFILMGINEQYFTNVKHAADFCLFIVPEHRGGSLVIRLIDEATKWAQENGAKDITIRHNTGIKTDSAPRLFNKLGFDLDGYIFKKEIGNVRNS